MKQLKYAVALFAAVVIAACGGSDGTPAPTRIQFSSLVSFGDSLSDLGTYSVGTVQALGGGKYTVNSATAKNWIEVMATQLGQSAACPAQTGLDGDPAQGFSVPVTNFLNCRAYGQGGARVTDPVGPGNKLLGGANATLGQLTVPVVTQISTHLARNGGAFSGSEIVFVMAGGNDLFMNLALVPGIGAPAAITAMGTAGAELAAYVNTQITAKGANYVTVVNLPDLSETPFGTAAEAGAAGTKALINAMVTTFNTQLQAGLAANAKVLYIDAYTVSRDQVANPANYGISNATAPACDLTSPAPNALGSSLVCHAGNLNPGVNDQYLFADTVHPTPYGYQLLAQLVASKMTQRGWL